MKIGWILSLRQKIEKKLSAKIQKNTEDVCASSCFWVFRHDDAVDDAEDG
jgi:hypothetical protein